MNEEHAPVLTADELTQKIFDLLAEIGGLADTAAQRENDYDVAYAGALLSAEGTVEVKKAMAVKQCSQEWLAWQRARNNSRIAEQAAWNVLPKILSYYQTLAKNERELSGRIT